MGIVAPAKEGDDQSAGEVDEVRTPACASDEPEACSSHEEHDCQPSAARRGQGVRTTLVGMVEDLAAFRVAADDPHAEVREEGEEEEGQGGGHKVITTEILTYFSRP